MDRLNTVLILGDPGNDSGLNYLKTLIPVFKENGIEARLEEISLKDPSTPAPELDGVDLIVVAGGDGALMSLLRMLNHPSIPVYGINFGRVGFLMNPAREAHEVVGQIISGSCVQQHLPVLEATWKTTTGESGSAAGVNDVVLERASGQTVHLDVFIDGVRLNAYSGDGMIVATPAGSTAYSLAAGGPVIHPDVVGILATPLNAHRPVQFHSLQFPVVLPLETTIRLVGKGVDKRPIRLVVDGEANMDIQELSVSARGDFVTLLRLEGYQYVKGLVSRIIGEVGDDV
ncbi:MAG: NAD(+)/NADH kinase [Planctomycetota bacterium]|nr:NAD(+)/NADH kinase [Planctomycetota bacterium]MDG2084206.1 NAD(+)/NADH kinase [Planctomycetota bacterium]